jgi:site-specific DNA-methyltransferase (adenine-specific)
MKIFSPVWADVTGQLRSAHPAPYPLEIPRRLIRMFSFVGDTVLDPFSGTGTTALAALEMGRHSISVDVDPSYVELTEQRVRSSEVAGRIDVDRPAQRQASSAAAG